MEDDKHAPRRRGRPALPEGEKGITSTIRLTPARWEKLRRLGAAWLSKKIDQAKGPDEPASQRP